MQYEDYIANLTGLAVDVVNAGSALELTGMSAELFADHHVEPPPDTALGELLPLLRAALVAITTDGDIQPINELLIRYPPEVHLSAHDGTAHLHHARDGEPGLTWLGRSCGAGLAHVISGAPSVSVGRCEAIHCGRFFVDQSRNRSRKFCGNACASRTTVAAYRARVKG